MFEIKDATLNDAADMLKIYDYYVKNTAITFEYETPSIEEFRERAERVKERYPYLVICEGDEIKGYAYASTLIDRPAYGWSCEVTIYLDHNSRGKGQGRALYEVLEKRLREMGILNLYACIAYPHVEDEFLTKNSACFHEHLGFTKAGEFHNCGKKFDRWYNMIWMEKIIGWHE